MGKDIGELSEMDLIDLAVALDTRIRVVAHMIDTLGTDARATAYPAELDRCIALYSFMRRSLSR